MVNNKNINSNNSLFSVKNKLKINQLKQNYYVYLLKKQNLKIDKIQNKISIIENINLVDDNKFDKKLKKELLKFNYLKSKKEYNFNKNLLNNKKELILNKNLEKKQNLEKKYSELYILSSDLIYKIKIKKMEIDLKNKINKVKINSQINKYNYYLEGLKNLLKDEGYQNQISDIENEITKYQKITELENQKNKEKIYNLEKKFEFQKNKLDSWLVSDKKKKTKKFNQKINKLNKNFEIKQNKIFLMENDNQGNLLLEDETEKITNQINLAKEKYIKDREDKRKDNLEFLNSKKEKELKKLHLIENKIFDLDRKIKKFLEIKLSILKSLKQSNENLKKLQKLEFSISEVKILLDNYSDYNKIKEEEILRISRLSMYFGGLKAVNDVSFSINKNEIFGLIGPNGAGKTTIFNCVTKFYNPTFGTSYFRSSDNTIYDLKKYRPHEIISLGISRTFQNVIMAWDLNVLDNILVGAHSLYKTNLFQQYLGLRQLRIEDQIIKAKAFKILKEFNLLQYAYMYPGGLPYGILKKIEFARALITSPRLIILDEPAAGLNDTETKELAQLIKKIRDEYNLTVFLVEHDMSLVMSICDKVCAISFGKMMAIGTPSEIQKNEEVRKAYLGSE